jgi:hypothetical protein
MKKILLGALTALVVACSSGPSSVADLDRVLDITVDTLKKFETSVFNTKDEKAMQAFARELQLNMNISYPKPANKPVGIELAKDGSIKGYADENNNSTRDGGEEDLFKIQIDSEKQRIIASDQQHTRDFGISGMGLLAGFLMGSLLNRQRAAGVKPSSISQQKATPKSDYRKAYSSARSRAGSGSHSSGK